MTVNLSPAERDAQVVKHLAYRGEATIDQLALALGVTENAVAIYLRRLIEADVVVSRKESWDEVDARMARYQGPPIPKRSIRRKRLYALAAPELEA